MPKCVRLLIPALFLAVTGLAAQSSGPIQYQSPYLRVEFAPDQPAFLVLTVDSLGKGKLGSNPLTPPGKPGTPYQVRRAGTTVEYRPAAASPAAPPAWTFQCSPRQIHLRSHFTAGNPPPALVLNFNPHLNHATLLGLINDDSSVRLPALLHLPDLGTFRITSGAGKGVNLGYDAFRYHRPTQGDDYVRVTFPAATAALPEIDYNLEVVDIFPPLPKISGDPRFDGFRRDWLNIYQLNPRARVLANHAASDPVAFTVFLYSSMAVHTPPLAPGLTALDMVRQTLDRYLGGMKGYGMEGYRRRHPLRLYRYLSLTPDCRQRLRPRQQGSRLAGEELCRAEGMGRQNVGHGRGWGRIAGIPREWKLQLLAGENRGAPRQLVGHHRLWPSGRLLECACLPRPGEHGGLGPPGKPAG